MALNLAAWAWSPWNWPKRVKRGAFGLANAILFYLTLAPTDMLPKETLWDKAEHGLAWAVLTGVCLLLWPSRPRPAVIYAEILGAVIEVLQATMPLGRDGDWRDWCADSVGVAAALLAFVALQRFGRRV